MKEKIFAAVHTVFGVPPHELAGKRKHKHVTDARFAAAYFLRTEANMDRNEIDKAFGKAPNSSWASHAFYKCQDYGETDKKYAAKCQQVYGLIKGVAA